MKYFMNFFLIKSPYSILCHDPGLGLGPGPGQNLVPVRGPSQGPGFCPSLSPIIFMVLTLVFLVRSHSDSRGPRPKFLGIENIVSSAGSIKKAIGGGICSSFT